MPALLRSLKKEKNKSKTSSSNSGSYVDTANDVVEALDEAGFFETWYGKTTAAIGVIICLVIVAYILYRRKYHGDCYK